MSAWREQINRNTDLDWCNTIKTELKVYTQSTHDIQYNFKPSVATTWQPTT